MYMYMYVCGEYTPAICFAVIHTVLRTALLFESALGFLVRALHSASVVFFGFTRPLAFIYVGKPHMTNTPNCV